MIHQLEIDRHDYSGRRITDCPDWHNPATFIAWIEKNISPTPEQRYRSNAPVYTLDSAVNNKK
jgi:hypothetical protein